MTRFVLIESICYDLQRSIEPVCMVLKFLDSSSGTPLEVEGLGWQLKIAEEEILALRNKVDEQNQHLLIADQRWSILEEKADRKIEQQEAQAFESKVLQLMF